MEIARDRYLKKLIGAQDNGLIKIVTGLRRVEEQGFRMRIEG